MRTPDELAGKILRLQQAKMNPAVVEWLNALEEIKQDLLIQSLNEKGEEAVRAWGVQKGISMCLMLDKIFESQISMDTRAKILKP